MATMKEILVSYLTENKGTSFTIKELVDHFECSKKTLALALQSLEAHGLVLSKKHQIKFPGGATTFSKYQISEAPWKANNIPF